jgi:lipoprotein-anchoring transpeptidase ErfK/SrfK
MSRFSTFLSFRTGLLLAIVLLTIPARLHAQTSSQPKSDRLPEASTPSTPKKDPAVNTTPAKPDVAPQSSGSANNISAPKPLTNNSSTPATTPAPKPTVATGSQLPTIDGVNLVLNLKQKRVFVYKGDKVLAKYPVAIGKKGRETPTGEWQVMEKIKNPGWTSFKTGEFMNPGRENPLGSRWIGFWTDGRDMIGFHGTSKLQSIGKAVSNGCVRMYNRDVKAMYKLVKVGTVVRVVAE